MITNNAIILAKKENQSFWENAQYKVYWEGLIFINGILSGEESIKKLIEELNHTSIEKACQFLKGIFFLIIESKKNGDILALVDNAGFYHVFYTNTVISNSFLQLVKRERYTVTDMNPAAVAEFLHFGYLLSHNTYFDSVSRLRRDNILVFSKGNNTIRLLNKTNMDLPTGSSYASDIPAHLFEDHFDNLNKSLSNCNISVDLTGGIDTRLVATMLNHSGLQFETASSGGTAQYIDVLMSKRIAQLLGKPWFATIHSIATLEDDMSDMFFATDGLYDILYYHRLYQLQKERQSRGIDTVISGVGGELFKDYWWFHEFPLYNKKRSDINKFVDLRVMSSEPMQHILTDMYTEAGARIKKNLVSTLSYYILDRNTKTYDNIYYNVIMENLAGRILTSHNNFMKSYAPFLDLDLARVGFNLKRGERIYNIFHRREITRINPALAKCGTSENDITVSYDTVDMVCDIPKYLNEKVKRVLIKCKLIRQKDHSSLNAKDFYHDVRNMEPIRHFMEVLNDAGIVKRGTQTQDLDDKHLGAFLSLAMLIEHLNNDIVCQ